MKTMRALANNGFRSGSSSSKQGISSRLFHFKGTMRDDQPISAMNRTAPPHGLVYCHLDHNDFAGTYFLS